MFSEAIKVYLTIQASISTVQGEIDHKQSLCVKINTLKNKVVERRNSNVIMNKIITTIRLFVIMLSSLILPTRQVSVLYANNLYEEILSNQIAL